jgi:choloylglycine hydrolase
MLYLNACDFGPRDPAKPGVQAGLWGQYLLDNAANVSEALRLNEGIQVVMAESHGQKSNVHLAIEDASGDSAIIEFIGGKAVVHHGRQFKVMTNDPTYDEQLELLKKLDFSKPSSDTPLPGNVKPSARTIFRWCPRRRMSARRSPACLRLPAMCRCRSVRRIRDSEFTTPSIAR